MNKLLVVAKNPETYFIKRLIEEVGQQRVRLYNPWKDPLPTDYDRILFRSFGVYRSNIDLDFVRGSPFPVMNPIFSLEVFRSKSSQYRFFNSFSHPCLPWWELKHWQEGPGPFLVKPDQGQGGWGIRVFSSPELLQWKSEKMEEGDSSWIVQSYVEAREYRVFFIADERWTLLREPTQGVAANFTQEGKARLLSLPKHLQSPVEKLIADSRAFYGAIDLLDTRSGPVILELNTVPGIQQLEHLSKENLLKKLLNANYFCQKA